MTVTCPHCKGSGGTDEVDCTRCLGEGVVAGCRNCEDNPVMLGSQFCSVECEQEAEREAYRDLAADLAYRESIGD